MVERKRSVKYILGLKNQQLNKRKIQRVTFGNTAGYNLSKDIVKLAEACICSISKQSPVNENCGKILQNHCNGKSLNRMGITGENLPECMVKIITVIQQSPNLIL